MGSSISDLYSLVKTWTHHTLLFQFLALKNVPMTYLKVPIKAVNSIRKEALVNATSCTINSRAQLEQCQPFYHTHLTDSSPAPWWTRPALGSMSFFHHTTHTLYNNCNSHQLRELRRARASGHKPHKTWSSALTIRCNGREEQKCWAVELLISSSTAQ